MSSQIVRQQVFQVGVRMEERTKENDHLPLVGMHLYYVHPELGVLHPPLPIEGKLIADFFTLPARTPWMEQFDGGVRFLSRAATHPPYPEEGEPALPDTIVLGLAQPSPLHFAQFRDEMDGQFQMRIRARDEVFAVRPPAPAVASAP